MQTLLESLKVLSAFAVPVLVGTTVFYFRKQLRLILEAIPGAIGRMKGAEAFGVKLDLAELQTSTAQAGRDVQSDKAVVNSINPPQPSSDIQASAASLVSGSADNTEWIQHLAEYSTPTAVLATGSYIEREIKVLVATRGLLASYATPQQGIKLLVENGAITSNFQNAVDLFFSIRNAVAHGQTPGDLEPAFVESGLNLLNLLRSIPRSRHEVIRTDIVLYSDPDAVKRIENAVAVILKARDPYNRPSATTQIFPTTRQMIVGTFVTWEWNTQMSWGEAWFRDPTTGEIQTAWTNSAEFIGRNLAEI